jgi:KaiC/GvpD/RAD55 family RecA-like ATPase
MRRKVDGLAGQGVGRLPAELTEFLSRDTYSLLIKGASGSGKTILALTILGRIKTGDGTLYLSTRTSPLQLTKDYAWLVKRAGLSAVPTSGGAPEEQGWDTLVDARLDEPGIVFERITNVLMDKETPTVVVDSWEALSESMDDEALRTNIRVLQTWRERAGARLIFIGEDSSNTAIDSVVDGVVTLSEESFQGRRLREIFLTKLHGVKISRPRYSFSLENGIFHSFDPYRQSDFGLGGRRPESLAPKRGADRRHHGTGFQSLDEALGGGYPTKSLTWVEVDPRVDSMVVEAFLSATIREWATTGGSVLVQASEWFGSPSAARVKAPLGGAAPRRIMVWDPGSDGKKSRPGGVAGLRARLARAKAPVLVVLDLDKTLSSPQRTGPAALEQLVDFLRRNSELSILASQSNPARAPLSGMASTHLRITEIHGTVFAMSEKPWSELYAFVPRGSGNANPQLERVV